MSQVFEGVPGNQNLREHFREQMAISGNTSLCACAVLWLEELVQFRKEV